MRTGIIGSRRAVHGLVLGALLMALALPVHAQQNFYLGIDLHNWTLDPDGGDEWSDFGVRGKLGARIGDQVSLEGHLATGGSDTANDANLELDSLYGFFLRADIPLSRYAGLYGLMGYSTLKMDMDGASNSDSSVSFGFGGDFQVSGNTSLNVDWIRYIDESDFEYTALNIGARWWF